MKFLRWFHRTVGLVLGLWLMAMGITGTILAFWQDIDSTLHAGLIRTATAAPARPDIDAMVRLVTAAYPDRPLLMIDRYGLSDRETYPFVLGTRGAAWRDGPPQPAIEVFVDPARNAITGARDYWTWLRLIRSLHMELLRPPVGEWLVGGLGVVLFATVIAGATLWYRENRKWLMRGLRLQWHGSRPVFWRRLHTTVGIYIAVFLAIQAASGALAADYFPVKLWLGGLLHPAPAFAMTTPPRPVAPAVPLTADQVRDLAMAQHPASTMVQMTFPGPLAPIYSVRLFPTDQPKARYTRQYMIEPRSGTIVFAFDPAKMAPVDRLFSAWMIWIHNGRFIGIGGQIVLLLIGPALAMLCPTGLYMWWRKRPAARRTARGS